MTWQPQNLPQDHPAVSSGKIGVLLVNLGTPDEPTAPAVKRYLAEFLSDPRVIEIPQIVWQPILRGIILNTRPKKSAEAYRKVWTDDGSPLAAITRKQAQGLATRLGTDVQTRYAMRYGNPSIGGEMRALQKAGCDRILVAPLYPQYCAATTASVVDKVNEELGKMRWQPNLRFLPPYYDEPAYVDALASDIDRQLGTLPFEPELLILSFHGMPQRTFDLGDPYHCHCMKTSRLLSEKLGSDRMRIITTFQSRFGRAKWLEPATDRTLVAEAQAGTRSIAIAAPGFSADCVETLEELSIAGREQFCAAGGQDFAALSCLNDTPVGMEMLELLVRRELSGWI
jgi:ferrochelatase